jgi:hypothetical protein
MVLFLKRNPVSKGASAAKHASDWSSANLYSEFNTSVVWIDSGLVYAFDQPANPGPSLLLPMDDSESRLRDRVAEIKRVQEELEEIVKIENVQARAVRLKPFVHSDVFPAKQFALKELGLAGPSAVATITAMLDDAAFAVDTPELIKAYVAAGGEGVGQDLDARLREQLGFWRRTAPALPEGWQNLLDWPAREAPLTRYRETYELVLGLQRIRYSAALSTARQFRDFWRSVPQLSVFNQLIEECDRLIEHLSN